MFKKNKQKNKQKQHGYHCVGEMFKKLNYRNSEYYIKLRTRNVLSLRCLLEEKDFNKKYFCKKYPKVTSTILVQEKCNSYYEYYKKKHSYMCGSRKQELKTILTRCFFSVEEIIIDKPLNIISQFVYRVNSFFYWGSRMSKRFYWDYGYFLDTQYDFLVKMEKTIRDNDRHTTASQHADEIKEMYLALKRLSSDDYFGTLPGEIEYNWDMEENPDTTFTMVFDNDDELQRILKEKKNKDAEFLKKQDLELVGNAYISGKILTWWD